MTRPIVLLAVLVFAAQAQAAQLYRWVDDKGRVEWRDTPPPATAKKVEKRTIGGSVIETSTLPYSLQQAVKSFRSPSTPATAAKAATRPAPTCCGAASRTPRKARRTISTPTES
jgi:hypothetical protein